MANKKKYSYYVGILMTDGSTRFVTSVDYYDKTAMWEKGKDALEMDMSAADNLVFGLLMNLHYAFTVKVPNGITFHNAEAEEVTNEQNN